MKRVIIAAAAACLLSACGPAGGQTPSAAQRAAELADAAATADAAALDAEVDAQEAADAQQAPVSYAEMLSGIDGPPEAYEEPRGPDDPRWFGASLDRRTCDPITVVGVGSPYEFVELAQSEGRQWYIAHEGSDRVQVKDRDRPYWPGMIFIQGQRNCQNSVDLVVSMDR